MQGVSDSTMWQQELRRQFLSIRGALRSLQLQAEEQRRKNPQRQSSEGSWRVISPPSTRLSTR